MFNPILRAGGGWGGCQGKFVYLGYSKAVHKISMSYYAWNQSKCFCRWCGRLLSLVQFPALAKLNNKQQSRMYKYILRLMVILDSIYFAVFVFLDLIICFIIVHIYIISTAGSFEKGLVTVRRFCRIRNTMGGVQWRRKPSLGQNSGSISCRYQFHLLCSC